MKNTISVEKLFIIFTLLFSTVLVAQEKKKFVFEDSFIEAGESSEMNYGTNGDLRLQNPGKINKYNREVFLKFKIKKVEDVKTAVLYVYGRAFPKPGVIQSGIPIVVDGVSNDWQESGITWGRQPKVLLTIGQSELKKATKEEWHAITLDADFVKSQLNQGFLSLRIQQPKYNGLGGVIYSKEKTWSDGTSADKEPYIVINGKKAVEAKEAKAINKKEDKSVAHVITEKVSVATDVVVSDSPQGNDDLIVFGGKTKQTNKEVFLQYKTGAITNHIVKATLYLQVKSPSADAALAIYDAKGYNLDEEKTTLKYRPVTGENIASIDVKKSDEYTIIPMDVTKAAQKAHAIIRGDLTICITDSKHSEVPVYIGSRESDTYRSFLVLKTVDPVSLQAKNVKVELPNYPNPEKDRKRYDKWIVENPVPENAWVPELWKDYVMQGGRSRLNDFSYAGYHYGEKAIPVVENIIGKVTDFGAIPNDGIDDTKAIQKAFDKLARKKGVILFPKGRYIVNGDPENPTQLELNGSNIVLRGEGSGEDGTIIYMSNKYLPEKGFGDYVLEIGKEAPYFEKSSSKITTEAHRGDRTLIVESTDNFSSGDYVKIIFYSDKDEQGNRKVDLGRTLTYPLVEELEWTNFKKYDPYVSVNQIEKVVDANTVILKTALKMDVLMRWNPRLHYHKLHEEVGVENIRFEGDWHGPYKHHGSREMDYGWSALSMNNVANGWVKNVTFHNLTNDFRSIACKNVTVQDITITGAPGHHCIYGSKSYDLLVTDIEIIAPRTHGLGVTGINEGCVFTNATISGDDGELDFHGGGFPMCNLFENIRNASVAGAGAVQNIPHSGRENTFWNIEANSQKPLYEELKDEFIPYGFWNYWSTIERRKEVRTDCYKLYPGSLIIGVYKPQRTLKIGGVSSDRDEDFIYIEGLNKENVWPQSLYKAQLKLRTDQ
ncbi:DNRLRE domain-containing protein [Labilibacter sediminis]|nr:DNRLRE domain-containing protein [Labilibacter sediminis]